MDGVSGKAYSTSITEDMAGKTSLEIDHEGLECLIRFSLSFQKKPFLPGFRGIWSGMLGVLFRQSG